MPAITELWAWVIEDDGPDDEGVPAYYDDRVGVWSPMVGADRERVESLRPRAAALAKVLGKPIRLVRSTSLETVDTVEP